MPDFIETLSFLCFTPAVFGREVVLEIKELKVTVGEVCEGYFNDAEEGVVGYDIRLDIRQKYQREFVYKDNQRDEVILSALLTAATLWLLMKNKITNVRSAEKHLNLTKCTPTTSSPGAKAAKQCRKTARCSAVTAI